MNYNNLITLNSVWEILSTRNGFFNQYFTIISRKISLQVRCIPQHYWSRRIYTGIIDNILDMENSKRKAVPEGVGGCRTIIL